MLLGLDRTAAEDATSDPLLEQPTATSTKTAASSAARRHNLDVRYEVTAEAKETTRATRGLVSEPSLGVVVIDPVECVIRGDRLRLSLGHVGLEQVPPADEADDDVEQECLDATDEHLEVPVALLMHEMPERLPVLGLEPEEPAPEEEVDPEAYDEDHSQPDEEPSIRAPSTSLLTGPGHVHSKPRDAPIV